MFKQYNKLNALKKKLVDQITNIWFPIFCLVQVGAIVLLGLALGFTLEELPTVTKNTENGAFLGVLIMLAVPLSAWVAWWVAAVPFVFTGRLSQQELKGIMLKFRYPKYWL